MGDYGHGGGQMRGNPDSRPRGQGQRPNVQQLKLMGQIHPTGLTPNLLKLFEPRPPLEYKPPLEKRKLPAYTGMAQFVSHFAEREDPEYAVPVPKCETRVEKKARIRNNKLEQGAAKVAEELQKYDPQSDPNATGDPYKTLFVARLNYETSEQRIKREFEGYGPIKRVLYFLVLLCYQKMSWGQEQIASNKGSKWSGVLSFHKFASTIFVNWGKQA